VQQRFLVALGDLTASRYAPAKTASRQVIDTCAAAAG